jgi:5-formyltetrahydrofolate cyclo-ligase
MVQESKKELRREMKLVLSNLDKRWQAAAHVELCEQLTKFIAGLFGTASGHVLAWVPFFSGEVDLTPFIADALRHHTVYLPLIKANGLMTFAHIEEDWALSMAPGPRGVPQPPESSDDFAKLYDGRPLVAVVPGIAFDKEGRRLGRGAGHYDRFFAQPELQDAVRIGVCWSMQVISEVPNDHHDMRMDFVCHERGIMQIQSPGRDNGKPNDG